MLDMKTMTAIIEDMGYKPVVRVLFKEQLGGDVDGIEIHGCDGNASPVIYPNYYVDSTEEEFREVVEQAVRNAPNVDIDELLDNIVSLVKVRVVPSGRKYPFHTEPTVYEGISSCLWLPCGEIGSIKVTDELIEHVNNSYDELFKHAIFNTTADSRVYTFREFAIEQLNMPTELYDSWFGHCESSMMIISNKSLINGASSMLCGSVMDYACDRISTDKIVVIPCSRNEVIAFRLEDIGEAAPLANLIKEVNVNSLSENEVLGEKAYIYTKGKGVEVYAENEKTVGI